jgi:hypothetical protein
MSFFSSSSPLLSLPTSKAEEPQQGIQRMGQNPKKLSSNSDEK